MSVIKLDGHSHCDYLDVLRLPVLAKTIRQAKKILKDSNLKFDSIAFCGMSGALVAPALAVALKKKLIMVRKELDKRISHSGMTVEGFLNTKKYLFVDDFISTGSTFKFLRDQIKKEFAPSALCVGIFEYREFNLHEGWFRGKPLNEVPQSSKSDSHGLTTPVGIALSARAGLSLYATFIDPSGTLTATVSDDGDDIPF
jgi:hypothetical protein